MRKGEEKGRGGKFIVTSGCYDHYPVVSMSLSLTQYLAWCRAHSYSGKLWWLLDVPLPVQPSCWWPCSYQMSEEDRFWESVSWWLTELLLQVQGQRSLGDPQTSHLQLDMIPDKWVHRYDKSMLWDGSVRLTNWPKSKEATLISWWKEKVSRWHLISSAANAL